MKQQCNMVKAKRWRCIIGSTGGHSEIANDKPLSYMPQARHQMNVDESSALFATYDTMHACGFLIERRRATLK